MTTLHGNDWLTMTEAVKLTGYTDSHLRRMLGAGKLDGIKVSERAWLVDLNAAKELAKKPRVSGRPKKSTKNS
jgi:hypothetical protein